MAKLVLVYGTDADLETALSRLHAADLSDHLTVLQRPPEAERPLDDDPGDDGLVDHVGVPPVAAVSAGGQMGVPAAAPFAVAADPDAMHAGHSGLTQGDVEQATGARGEEAQHLHQLIEDGGKVVVLEGDDDLLDRAEAALDGLGVQGAVRR